MDRRNYLRTAGLLALTTLAGCVAAGAGESPSPETTESTLPVEPEYGDWFENVSNYDGTVDHRGEAEVLVHVGVKGNMGALGFGPAAVAVSPETTVVWEWTGNGGGHNVVSEDDAFDSGPLVADAGHRYTLRFDDVGTYRYVCEPHRTMGMRGAVVVVEN
ncbi:halocyanin domain-containing protein [Haloferax sp. DFSO52]|uniref:halocyanin domain-containing protein n=1 Tax=Haloferax sp. DFSO52 TaxID=3388505 RepID=UPI003A854E4A